MVERVYQLVPITDRFLARYCAFTYASRFGSSHVCIRCTDDPALHLAGLARNLFPVGGATVSRLQVLGQSDVRIHRTDLFEKILLNCM